MGLNRDFEYHQNIYWKLIMSSFKDYLKRTSHNPTIHYKNSPTCRTFTTVIKRFLCKSISPFCALFQFYPSSCIQNLKRYKMRVINLPTPGQPGMRKHIIQTQNWTTNTDQAEVGLLQLLPTQPTPVPNQSNFLKKKYQSYDNNKKPNINR